MGLLENKCHLNCGIAKGKTKNYAQFFKKVASSWQESKTAKNGSLCL